MVSVGGRTSGIQRNQVDYEKQQGLLALTRLDGDYCPRCLSFCRARLLWKCLTFDGALFKHFSHFSLCASSWWRFYFRHGTATVSPVVGMWCEAIWRARKHNKLKMAQLTPTVLRSVKRIMSFNSSLASKRRLKPNKWLMTLENVE